MNIKRAKEEIKNSIAAYLAKDARGEYEIPSMRQRPVLLMGPPGIGKTQIMEQIARECGIGLVSYTITHHTRQSAIGLPFISEKEFGGEKKHVTEYTMSEIVAAVYDRMEETGLSEGILFIDEINCVSETLAPAMLQFLQYKTFGNHKIPDGWLIAAAGNPPEYNKSVRDFDIATLDRVKKIEVEPDFEVWKEYARKANIHPAILSYLSAKPQYFCQVETTVDGKMFATPRGWEDLSRLLEVYEKLGKEADREVVGQYIQHGKIARDFANYLELYNRYQAEYQIEEVLNGKSSPLLMERAAKSPFDERLSVIGLILAKLNTAFRKAGEQELYLETVFQELKGYKEELEKSGGEAAMAVDRLDSCGSDVRSPESTEEALFTARLERFCAVHEQKKKAGLLTRGEDYLYRDVEETLDRYLQMARGESLFSRKGAAFGRFAELFGQERGRYEALCTRAGQMLERAFDFLEGAFGDSQEMVMFITELNSSYYAVSFLQENPCERYFFYNKKLLFSDREADIKRRLSGLGIV